MNGKSKVVRDQLKRLRDLEQRAVRFRLGTVTSLNPLSVTLGGSSTPSTSVRALRSAAVKVNDTVAVITFGNGLLVLGTVTSTPRRRGRIDLSAASGSGDGFTWTRTGTGQCAITFVPAFATTPEVQVTSYTSPLYAHLDGNPTTSAAAVRLRSDSGTATNGVFSFTAEP